MRGGRRDDEVDFLEGGGEMGARMRAHDWRQTPVGPPAAWPQSLRTAVRLMLNTGHPMYIFWGPEGSCLYNDAYRQSIGPERHPGSLGRPAREVWAEIWAIIGPQIEQVMAGRGATWHENQLVPITRNGTLEDVYWTYSYGPIDDAATPGGVGGVLVVCAETTDQVVGARRLAESEERLQLALSAGKGIGTWDWDVEHDRVVADERFARLYGVDPAQAKVGAPVAAFFAAMHPDDAGRVQARIAAALRTGEDFNEEYRLIRPDGSERWVAAQGRCTLAPDGRPLRFPGVSFDITTRKTNEQRRALLQDLIWQQRQATDETAVMRAAAAAVGRFLKADRTGFLEFADDDQATHGVGWTAGRLPLLEGAFQAAGLGADALARLRAGEMLIFADVRIDRVVAADFFARIDTRSGMSAPVIRDGRWRTSLYVHHAEPRVWQGDQASLVREVADVTWDAVERLRARTALEAANATLAERVAIAMREHAKTEEALRQSQKMEAVGQLTGGLAHDFNNLLTGISGSLEMLQARIAQGRMDTVDRYIAAARGAAKRAATLTHRLLAFARQQTLDPKPTNVNRLIAGMEEFIRRTVGPAVEMEVAGAEDIWTILVDPNQLENALLNLSLNARDAMPDGGRLKIASANEWLDEPAARKRHLPPGQYVSLDVTDTGTGMPPDVAARAFDPFFTTKPIGQGTGLGLSMIYGFVRQSGGEARIDSAVGRGTTVRLYFPRHDDAVALDDEAAPATAPADAGAGEVVLIIDDEPTIRMLIAEVLEDAGYSTIEAPDGPSGLRVLQSARRIDLLVTDVGLPGGMNGRQVANAARLLRPQLKVLFITGFAENAAITDPDREKGTLMVAKPFAMDALARKIRELIES